MPTVFGERLRALRLAARLTQEELAERAGLTAAGISAIERGTRTRAYPRTVTALAGALSLTGEDREAFTALAGRPGPGEPLPGLAVQAALPAQLTTFVGRERDLARVRLLQECPRLAILATSREPLRVPGEAVLPVGPLTCGESAALFEARTAASAGNRFHPVGCEDVQQLLARLDGMPLAIELAAAALRVFTPDQILGQL